MSIRYIRRFAVLLLAAYAFAQASVAVAACGMDRAAMAQAMTMSAGDTCDDCAKPNGDSVTATCFVHCTADAQSASTADFPSVASAVAEAALAPRGELFRPPPIAVLSPPGALPRRILLHSFQV